MFVAYVAVTVLAVLANTAIAVADLRPARFVLVNSAAVGLSAGRLPVLAALKAAGALGLLIGLLGVLAESPVAVAVGIAAAIGLVLFFVGALIAHARARVWHNLGYPIGYWLLAVASLGLLLAVA